jgi:membrane-bound lytic murein transglycosylase B
VLLLLVVTLGGTRAPVTLVVPVVDPAAPVMRSGVHPAPRHQTSAVEVSGAWVTSTASASGIPEPAVRAYAAATLAVARTEPGCHLGWTTLAGIGWVESQHGTIGGRTLEDDGRSDRPIHGPALDGQGRLAAIPDAHGGWARAEGPLQFLPGTWSRWAADGDGDGRTDPQDLDDASLGAADYLCASGQDLATGAGWSAAVRSYNHSDAYVGAVYDAASAYAARTAS